MVIHSESIYIDLKTYRISLQACQSYTRTQRKQVEEFLEYLTVSLRFSHAENRLLLEEIKGLYIKERDDTKVIGMLEKYMVIFESRLNRCIGNVIVLVLMAIGFTLMLFIQRVTFY